MLNKTNYWLRISIMLVVALLLLTVSTVTGQGSDDEADEGFESIESPASGEIILAQPPNTMNYQGYLTDGDGNPLNGTYDLVFRLYDASVSGAIEWGPETHSSVLVSNGLFQVALGTSETLFGHDFDIALWLAVEVDGVSISPRQPLHAVPYAFGLVPGAIVEGDPLGSDAALWVENTGDMQYDYGLRAVGEKYGLIAEEVGDGDVGIYSPDVIEAKGFRSVMDSYLWVPGTSGMFFPTPGCDVYPQRHGSARIECTDAGTKYFNIGVPLPAVLYGQSVYVEEIRVYYALNHSASYITSTQLRRMTTAWSSVTLIDDPTNQNFANSTSYALAPTQNYTMTASYGGLNLRLELVHDGDIDHDIYVGGVRVRLRHYVP